MSDLNIALILRLVDKATAPARDAIKKVEQMGGRLRALGREQLALSRDQFTASVERNRALMGEAAGLAATGYGFYRLLRPAAQFEEQMARVGAISRASDGDLARLTAQARQLGKDTPWAASQAAEGMQFLAMAGFDVNETMAAMPGMLNLASAASADLGSTADIASNILTGFTLRAAEMGRVGDVLTNTFTTSNTDLAMLGQTMKYVAPVAAAAGVSLEQAAGMAGKLGDAGIQGENAGTALRAMLARLVAPTNEAAKALDTLAISVADKDGNLRDMPTILAEMDAAMKDMGSAARGDLISAVFGVEAMSAATVLLGQAGSGDLQTYIDGLKETGSAARVAAKINDNTAGAVKRLQSQTEALSITLGTALLPVIVEMIDRLMPVIGAFEKWAAANPELVQTIGWVVAALFGLRVAVLGLRMAFNSVLAVFWIFNGGLAVLTYAIGAAPAVFGVLVTAIQGVSAALVAAGAWLWANPLILIIGAIAGGAVLIYRNWEGLVDFFQGLWEGLKSIFAEIKAAIAETFKVPDWVQDGSMMPYKGPNVTLPGGPGPSNGAEIQSYLDNTPGRALGGPVRSGQIYRWMEEGQEFFSPRTDGSVISTRAVKALRAGGAGRSVRIGDIVIHAAQGQSAEDIAREVMRRLERLAAQAGVPLHDGGGYAA